VKTRLILKSGQPGAKTLTRKYGDSLLCVRFRYDAESRQRLKTVELIIERTPWTPPVKHYTAETVVPLQREPFNMTMRAQVKTAGGKWNPEKRLWFEKYAKIAGTPLENYIYVDES